MSKNLWNNDIRDFFYGDNCFNKWLFSLFLDYRCNRIFWNNTLSKPVTHIWIYWNTSIKKTNVVQKLSWTISPTEFWFFVWKLFLMGQNHELPTLCWKLRRFEVRSWKKSGSGMYFDRIGVLKYLLGFWLSSLFSGNDLCLGMPNILGKPEISGNIRYFGLPKISTDFQKWIGRVPISKKLGSRLAL